MVGEIRDAETAHIAVQSALTGHFVLSSLHATDASAALLRILDMGVEPFVVASSVIAVLSQRLVRRICGQCKQPYSPTAAELEFFREAGGVVAVEGFLARRRLHVLRARPATRTASASTNCCSCRRHEGTRHRASRRMSRSATLAQAEGMRTLREEGVRLVTEGVTTVSEVIRSIYML